MAIQTQQFNITGMHCASCAGLIERGLKKVNGVKTLMLTLQLKKRAWFLTAHSHQ